MSFLSSHIRNTQPCPKRKKKSQGFHNELRVQDSEILMVWGTLQ